MNESSKMKLCDQSPLSDEDIAYLNRVLRESCVM